MKKIRPHWVLLGFIVSLALLLGGCRANSGTSADTDEAVPEEAQVAVSEWTDENVNPEAEKISEGEYSVFVKLEGGSGKASLASPTTLTYRDGEWTLKLLWSSSDYDYMIVGDDRYEPVSTDGGSLFEIVIPEPAGEIPVLADTTAMGTPHEIEYTVILSAEGEEEPSDGTGQLAEDGSETSKGPSEETAQWRLEHEPSSTMDLKYATGFSVDNYEDGSSLVIINATGDAFYLLPEGEMLPQDLPEDVTVLNTPLSMIYLVSTGVMDMFRAMNGLDAVRFCSENASGWDMPEVVEAMEEGKMIYAGKYSTPDYERLLAEGCDLAVENTMIYHAPEAMEQLENLGIPVLVDYTSYENEPLGRCEWIKLYGLLTDHESEAIAAFDEQEKLFLKAASGEPTGQTVAFFYITQKGLVNVRRSSDYLARMIDMAGGEYIFADLGSPNANSPNVSMQIEEFYARAKDADILIYNGSVGEEMSSVDDLILKSPLFASFRAVENGNAFCARKSMYQASMEMGVVMSDLRAMFTGDDEKLIYFYRLK